MKKRPTAQAAPHQSRHIQRLSAEIVTALSSILQRDYSEVFGMVSINRIKLSPDQWYADLYCTSLPFSPSQAAMPEGAQLALTLNEHAKELRFKLSQSIQTRHTPELRFHEDLEPGTLERLDQLLKNP